MKTGRKSISFYTLMDRGFFITGSTIIFLVNIDSYWIPAVDWIHFLPLFTHQKVKKGTLALIL